MNHLGDTNKMVSDTPRTDELLTAMLEVYGYVHQGNCPQQWVNYARELERELNAANESFRKLNIHALNLADRIKRLEDAGDFLSRYLREMPYASDYLAQVDERILRISNWRRAKEDNL